VGRRYPIRVADSVCFVVSLHALPRAGAQRLCEPELILEDFPRKRFTVADQSKRVDHDRPSVDGDERARLRSWIADRNPPSSTLHQSPIVDVNFPRFCRHLG